MYGYSVMSLVIELHKSHRKNHVFMKYVISTHISMNITPKCLSVQQGNPFIEHLTYMMKTKCRNLANNSRRVNNS